MDYKLLEEMIKKQGRDKRAKYLLKLILEKCKFEKKSPKEALSEINQAIINPNSFGVC